MENSLLRSAVKTYGRAGRSSRCYRPSILTTRHQGSVSNSNEDVFDKLLTNGTKEFELESNIHLKDGHFDYIETIEVGQLKVTPCNKVPKSDHSVKKWRNTCLEVSRIKHTFLFDNAYSPTNDLAGISIYQPHSTVIKGHRQKANNFRKWKKQKLKARSNLPDNLQKYLDKDFSNNVIEKRLQFRPNAFNQQLKKINVTSTRHKARSALRKRRLFCQNDHTKMQLNPQSTVVSDLQVPQKNGLQMGKNLISENTTMENNEFRDNVLKCSQFNATECDVLIGMLGNMSIFDPKMRSTPKSDKSSPDVIKEIDYEPVACDKEQNLSIKNACIRSSFYDFNEPSSYSNGVKISPKIHSSVKNMNDTDKQNLNQSIGNSFYSFNGSRILMVTPNSKVQSCVKNMDTDGTILGPRSFPDKFDTSVVSLPFNDSSIHNANGFPSNSHVKRSITFISNPFDKSEIYNNEMQLLVEQQNNLLDNLSNPRKSSFNNCENLHNNAAMKDTFGMCMKTIKSLTLQNEVGSTGAVCGDELKTDIGTVIYSDIEDSVLNKLDISQYENKSYTSHTSDCTDLSKDSSLQSDICDNESKLENRSIIIVHSDTENTISKKSDSFQPGNESSALNVENLSLLNSMCDPESKSDNVTVICSDMKQPRNESAVSSFKDLSFYLGNKGSNVSCQPMNLSNDSICSSRELNDERMFKEMSRNKSVVSVHGCDGGISDNGLNEAVPNINESFSDVNDIVNGVSDSVNEFDDTNEIEEPYCRSDRNKSFEESDSKCNATYIVTNNTVLSSPEKDTFLLHHMSSSNSVCKLRDYSYVHNADYLDDSSKSYSGVTFKHHVGDFERSNDSYCSYTTCSDVKLLNIQSISRNSVHNNSINVDSNAASRYTINDSLNSIDTICSDSLNISANDDPVRSAKNVFNSDLEIENLYCNVSGASNNWHNSTSLMSASQFYHTTTDISPILSPRNRSILGDITNSVRRNIPDRSLNCGTTKKSCVLNEQLVYKDCFSSDNSFRNLTTRRKKHVTFTETLIVEDEACNSLEISPSTHPSMFLAPGKKWRRSFMTLMGLLNRSITFDKSETKNKGRNWLKSVKELVHQQTAVSICQNSTFNCTTTSISNLTYFPPIDEDCTIEELSAVLENCILYDDPLKPRFSMSLKPSYEHQPLTDLLPSDLDNTLMPETSNCEDSYLCCESTIVTADNLEYGKTPKDIVLNRCHQKEPLPFEQCFPDDVLEGCTKIGEGVYGEVFSLLKKSGCKSVLKIIPIEGDQLVNGERQKKYEEILSEIVISVELSNLCHGSSYYTDSFCKVIHCLCIQGKYPNRLIKLWNDYNEWKGSDNDSPIMFTDEQLYIILELGDGGSDAEAFPFNSAQQAYSVIQQTALALAVAEEALQFEHRDLHWGNILISRTTKKELIYKFHNEEYTVRLNGVKVTIIDFTLSRMTFKGITIFNNLGEDLELFNAEGDFQFEVYRLMKNSVKYLLQKVKINSVSYNIEVVKFGSNCLNLSFMLIRVQSANRVNPNIWDTFEPATNIHWLTYIMDKMLHEVKYKRTNTKTHKNSLQVIEELYYSVSNFKSAYDFISTKFVNSSNKQG